LLVLNDASAPAELILTPRHGGASPPGPNAVPHDDDAEDLPPQRIHPVSRANQPPSEALSHAPFGAPGGAGPTPSTPAPAAATADSAASPVSSPAATSAASDTTTQQSPNGVKTPQQIYEQLLKMQQKAPTQTTPQ